MILCRKWLVMLLVFLSGCTCVSCYDVDLWMKCSDVDSGYLKILIQDNNNKVLLQKNYLMPEECNDQTNIYNQIVKNSAFDSISVTASLFKPDKAEPYFSITEKWPGAAGMGDQGKDMPTVLLEIELNGKAPDKLIEFKGLL